MDKYDKWYGEMSDLLMSGEAFALRMNLDGEGRYKMFQNPGELMALKSFLDSARNAHVTDITMRFADTMASVISEN